MIAKSVVQSEMRKYWKDDSLKFTIDTKNNDLAHLRVTLTPPDNSPYEDGIFFLSVTIPSRYPSVPPNIEFETIIYHPNITSDEKYVLVNSNQNGNVLLHLKMQLTLFIVYLKIQTGTIRLLYQLQINIKKILKNLIKLRANGQRNMLNKINC